jgi:hypothetical protein
MDARADSGFSVFVSVSVSVFVSVFVAGERAESRGRSSSKSLSENAAASASWNCFVSGSSCRRKLVESCSFPAMRFSPP